MLTQKRLKEILLYNPETGVFTYKVSKGCRKAGDVAGCLDKGYICVKVDKKKYSAHRLCFLYMLGRLPEDSLDVDHINRVKDDNRWVNLREATRTENALNTKTNSNNKLSSSNIRQLKDTKKYQVRLAGKSYGCFDKLSDAEECYRGIQWQG